MRTLAQILQTLCLSRKHGRTSLPPRYLFVLFLFVSASVLASHAQTYTVLSDLTPATKLIHKATLVQGVDGNLYGTSVLGGSHNRGTVFRVTPGGTLTVMHSFCKLANCADGATPFAGLTVGNDGNLYGVAAYGGTGTCPTSKTGCGTVFKVALNGTLTTLYNFASTDGSDPQAPLLLASNGSFYGTTVAGGANNSGTVFKITPSGTLTTLYSFCSLANCTDGLWPYTGLTQGRDGNFYGTTNGSDSIGGTVFKLTPGGTLTTLFTFCNALGFYCADGAVPSALVQAANGDFYGTTFDGGPVAAGTIFRITSKGQLTAIHTFQDGANDGRGPVDALTLGTDGNFYGTTESGGLTGSGLLFEITPSGTFTALYSLFCEPDLCLDGSTPADGLAQATDGNFYGIAPAGGNTNEGTFFSLATGLGPFTETLPTSGTVGTHVTILGTDLTGTKSVSFNGKAAAFKIISSTQIWTNVPAGATTGTVSVTTPAGTLTSNTVFRVR